MMKERTGREMNSIIERCPDGNLVANVSASLRFFGRLECLQRCFGRFFRRAQFFERRDDRDEAILIRARAGAGAKLADLVGPDYPLLKRTRLGGPVRSLARLSGI